MSETGLFLGFADPGACHGIPGTVQCELTDRAVVEGEDHRVLPGRDVELPGGPRTGSPSSPRRWAVCSALLAASPSTLEIGVSAGDTPSGQLISNAPAGRVGRTGLRDRNQLDRARNSCSRASLPESRGSESDDGCCFQRGPHKSGARRDSQVYRGRDRCRCCAVSWIPAVTLDIHRGRPDHWAADIFHRAHRYHDAALGPPG